MTSPVSTVTEAEGLRIASLTDVGRRRTENEDSHAVWVSDDLAERQRLGVLFMVADGMGGANAGEVASHMATEVVVREVRARAEGDPAEALREAIEAANDAIHHQAGNNADQRGMGTTCTAVVVRGTDVWVGHVGDSRAYLVRAGQLTRLTRDHSLVAELVERGHLTEEDAKHDPRRNVVTRSVGATDAVQVDAEHVGERLRSGDTLVVCSDGLHGQVTDEEIARFASEFEPEDACLRLIETANERGGPDNITVIVARAGASGGTEARANGAAAETARDAGAPSGGRRGLLPVLLIALVVVVAAIALLGRQVVHLARSGGDASAPSASAPEAASEPAATNAPPASEPGSSAPEPAPRSAAPAPTARPVTDTRPQAQVVTPPAKATGSLFVMTRPFQPCDFTLDGNLYSEAVGSIRVTDLSAGRHVVKVRAANGSTELTVDVAADDVTESIATLPGANAVGTLKVSLAGGGTARLLVDGAQYPNLAPCLVRDLPAGTHRLRAVRQGAHPQSVDVTVDVTSGGTTPVEITFPSMP